MGLALVAVPPYRCSERERYLASGFGPGECFPFWQARASPRLGEHAQ
jgi:hypothetical protein